MFVDHYSGSRLQLTIPRDRSDICIAKRDHRPIITIGEFNLHFEQWQPASTARWDLAKLTNTIRYGDQRADLFRDLATKLSDWQVELSEKPDIPMQLCTNAASKAASIFSQDGPHALHTSRAAARDDWKVANRLRCKRWVAIKIPRGTSGGLWGERGGAKQ